MFTKIEKTADGIVLTLPNNGTVPVLHERKVADNLPVDFSKMEIDTLSYIWEYGLRQTCNDRAASEKDLDKRRELIGKRIDALESNNLRQRSEGEPADPVEAEIRKIAKADLEARYKERKLAWRGKNAQITQEKYDEHLAALIEKRRPEYTKLANKRLAEMAKLKDAAGDDLDDLLGDVIGDIAGHTEPNESADNESEDNE